MTERHSFNPEAVNHLRTIAQKGSVQTDDPAHHAIHGTSLEAIDHLAREGRLLGKVKSEPPYKRGDLSVFPTQSFPLFKDFLALGQNEEEIRDRAIAYARANAKAHHLLTLLDQPLDNRAAIRWARDLVTIPDETLSGKPRALGYFKRRGIAEEAVTEALKKAERRKGFLLGVSSTIHQSKEIEVVPGDRGEGDIALREKGGVRYTFLSGIEPLGRAERDFMTKRIGK